MSKSIKSIVEGMLHNILEAGEFELVDVEYVKEGSNRFLRVYMDKDGGIDIEDCGRISEILSQKLDAEDPIPDAYFLEVCSPGAERPLKKPKDYEKAIGKHVFVTTYEPIGGLKEFEGVLQQYDGETLSILAGKKLHEVPMSKVASARLAIVF